MARFAVQLLLPGLAWDLLADLEPILRLAREAGSYSVEVLDGAGVIDTPDVASARAQSAERGQSPQRITLAITGHAGPGEGEQPNREYSVLVWTSRLDDKTGATISGHTVANGARARTYAEGLLDEIEEHTRAFLQNKHLLLPDKHQTQRRDAEPAADPAVPTKPRSGLIEFLSHQPLANQIVGGAIAALLAAAIITGVAWLANR